MSLNALPAILVWSFTIVFLASLVFLVIDIIRSGDY